MLLITNTGTAFGITSGDGSTVEKAKVINSAYDDRVIDTNTRFKFNKSNCTITWGKDATHRTATRRDGKATTGYCLKYKYTADTEYTNPVRLDFTNCGKINGRNVNIRINFDKVTIGKRYNSSDDVQADELGIDKNNGYATIFQLSNTGNLFELYCSSATTYGGHRGKKTAQLTTTVTYSDTGEIVDLPFLLGVQDIDQISSWKGTVYAYEQWTAANSGYKSFYIYNENKTNRTGNTIKTTQTIYNMNNKSGTDGEEQEIKIAGIYATTNNGKFTCTFSAGNAGTDYRLYSQYKDGTLSMPTKSVDKSTAKPTDTLTYNVDQKIGTYITTMMEPYGKLKITDTVPNYLTYVDGSAKLYSIETIKVGPQEEEREVKTDITNQANISYTSSNKLLTCELKDSWRTNVANYNGQTLRLEFKGKISKITPHNTNIKNTGHVQVETSLTNDTNEVNTLVQKHKPGDSTTYVRIRIRIKDDKNVLMDAHGKPTFIFKIIANGREYYRSVTFGDEDASKDWTFEKKNGYIIATGKMEDLRESGEDKVTCEVSTVDVSRFKVTAEDMIPEFPKEDSDDECFTYPFVAEKTTWQYYSHNDIKVNRLTK